MAFTDIQQGRTSPGAEAVLAGGRNITQAGINYFGNMMDLYKNAHLAPQIAKATAESQAIPVLIENARLAGYGQHPVAVNPQTGQPGVAAGPPAVLPNGYYLGENNPGAAYQRIWQDIMDSVQLLPMVRRPESGRGFLMMPNFGFGGGTPKERGR